MADAELRLECVECRFDFPLDDMYLTFSQGFGICEPCHRRIIDEDEKPMDRKLVRNVERTLQAQAEWKL